jgi:hypothetical protein
VFETLEGAAELGAEVGEGVRRRSGVVVEVGDDVVVVAGAFVGPAPGLGDFCGGGGIGGRPPLPRPLRMERVSFRSRCARSCWPRETRVKARVSMSEVRSSMRRCTTLGCGGMGGLFGHTDCFFCCWDVAGSMVIARREGLGRCIRVPSRSRSPHVKSAWIRGTSSTDTVRWSS